MRRKKRFSKILLTLSCALGGGTVVANGCMNTLASLPLCGTILTFCTPADQLKLFFPYLEVPNYTVDPSCTIPLGCGGNDLFPNIPPGFPGSGGGAAGG